jgi:hypothetical protein
MIIGYCQELHRVNKISDMSRHSLTLILPMWRIWLASNNASKWQMKFNSAFKGLTQSER